MVSFAFATASSRPSYVMNETTGPKIYSSAKTKLDSTSSNTVGSTK